LYRKEEKCNHDGVKGKNKGEGKRKPPFIFSFTCPSKKVDIGDYQ